MKCKMLFQLLVIAFAAIAAVSPHVSFPRNRIARATGDQAPPGTCLLFTYGGISRLHWYSCCNNCNQNDTSCDGKSYQSASSEDYCDPCGTDGTGDGKKHDEFSCGGCADQDEVEKSCKAGWRQFVNIPGFCWVFARCFRSRCKDREQSSLCYDFVCDPGENVQNCPVDCCSTVNPGNCTATNGTCLPKCCGESSCCMGGTNAGSNNYPIASVLVCVLQFAIMFT